MNLLSSILITKINNVNFSLSKRKDIAQMQCISLLAIFSQLTFSPTIAEWALLFVILLDMLIKNSFSERGDAHVGRNESF